MSSTRMLCSRRSAGGHAAGLERGLDVFQYGKPGKQRKALEHDGNIDSASAMGFPCQ